MYVQCNASTFFCHSALYLTVERSVVGIFKRYLPTIPRDGAFCKRPIDYADGRMSFPAQSIGVNTLGEYVKRMFAQADIHTVGRRICNHSLRVC